MTPEEVRALMPKVVDIRMERPTIDGLEGQGYGQTPRRCTVVEVNTEHLWYTVEFEDGIRESYKAPELDLGPLGGLQPW